MGASVGGAWNRPFSLRRCASYTRRDSFGRLLISSAVDTMLKPYAVAAIQKLVASEVGTSGTGMDGCRWVLPPGNSGALQPYIRGLPLGSPTPSLAPWEGFLNPRLRAYLLLSFFLIWSEVVPMPPIPLPSSRGGGGRGFVAVTAELSHDRPAHMLHPPLALGNCLI